MTRAEIYRRAAENLESMGNMWGCCDHVALVATGDEFSTSVESAEFAEVFMPFKGAELYWGLLWNEDDPTPCRVLALCFASAMSAAGDL